MKAIIVNGPAYNKGLRPGMKLLKLNNIHFIDSEGFCAVANAMDKSQKTLNITFEDFDGIIHNEVLVKKILK